jgi:hypothetical protein
MPFGNRWRFERVLETDAGSGAEPVVNTPSFCSQGVGFLFFRIASSSSR